jgi:hypothetical protein
VRERHHGQGRRALASRGLDDAIRRDARLPGQLGATAPNDFCVVSVNSTPTAGVVIQGNSMTINLAASKLPDAGSGPISVDDLDAAVGFTVHGGDAGCTTGLGVRVRT